jgi:hypothetical protein
MHPEQQIEVQKRRPRSEVRQLVAEFVNSGIEATEFCRSRGLSRSTLYHHLKKKPAEGNPVSEGIELLAVEVAGVKCSSPIGQGQLAVVLGNARRVEVNPGFDAATLARLVSVLEGV